MHDFLFLPEQNLDTEYLTVLSLLYFFVSSLSNYASNCLGIQKYDQITIDIFSQGCVMKILNHFFLVV